MFRPNNSPFILVFQRDKVYKVKFMKTTITSEDILEMLSADKFIQMSDVYAEDTDYLFKQLSGQAGSAWDRFLSQYGNKFEQDFNAFAKKTFKQVNLSHWRDQSKVIFLLVVFMAPICFGLIIGICSLIFWCMNIYYSREHRQTLTSLMQEE